MFYYSFQAIKHLKILSKQSDKVLHCRMTNSQLEYTTIRILVLDVPNLQILIMEWQNVDLQISQFGEHTATTESQISLRFRSCHWYDGVTCWPNISIQSHADLTSNKTQDLFSR